MVIGRQAGMVRDFQSTPVVYVIQDRMENVEIQCDG